MIISQADIVLFFLAFVRVGGLLSLIPVFGGKVIPVQIRLALALGIALLLYPILYENFQAPIHFIEIAINTAKELFIGIIMGFAVRMIFFIGEFAGALISVESGLMRSDNFDPIIQAQSTTVSTLLFYFGMVFIFVTGSHYSILKSLVASYNLIPIGAPFFAFSNINAFVRETSQIFILGFKIAAPIIALSFVINMSFAVLGKIVPKMNVFITSFAVRILAGLSLLLLILGLIVQYYYSYIQYIPKRMLEFLSY